MWNYRRTLFPALIYTIKKKETMDSRNEGLSKSVIGRLSSDLKAIGLYSWPEKIMMVGLKREEILEVYAVVDGENRLMKKYPFTAFSGEIGPKLKEGDGQIPEGIYKIEYLNPNSAFYLSLKINYPNEFDKKMGSKDNRSNLGFDIFIHGKAKTIGCIPLGDQAIEEVFLLASNVKNKNIEVVIAPHDFRIDKKYPSIPHVEWSDQLYKMISKRLSSV